MMVRRGRHHHSTTSATSAFAPPPPLKTSRRDVEALPLEDNTQEDAADQADYEDDDDEVEASGEEDSRRLPSQEDEVGGSYMKRKDHVGNETGGHCQHPLLRHVEEVEG